MNSAPAPARSGHEGWQSNARVEVFGVGAAADFLKEPSEHRAFGDWVGLRKNTNSPILNPKP